MQHAGTNVSLLSLSLSPSFCRISHRAHNLCFNIRAFLKAMLHDSSRRRLRISPSYRRTRRKGTRSLEWHNSWVNTNRMREKNKTCRFSFFHSAGPCLLVAIHDHLWINTEAQLYLGGNILPRVYIIFIVSHGNTDARAYNIHETHGTVGNFSDLKIHFRVILNNIDFRRVKRDTAHKRRKKKKVEISWFYCIKKYSFRIWIFDLYCDSRVIDNCVNTVMIVTIVSYSSAIMNIMNSWNIYLSTWLWNVVEWDIKKNRSSDWWVFEDF